MILGYEKPVDIPVMSIYDKDMMKMYLGALLKDYELGVADAKEFLKNYGDFVSIMPGASEAYYNAGMKGINDTYDRLVANGIDPLRSKEGRAAMGVARMRANTALMANIKADSAAYELYLKAAAALAVQGKYDKAQSDWWLKLNGIDPNNWDFSGSKRWDVIAPLLRASIQELLAPTIAELAKTGYEKDYNLSKNGREVLVVKRKSIDAAMNKGIDDLLKDPRMQYFYDTSGLSKEEFLNKLGNEAEGILRPKETEDKTYFDLANLALKQREVLIAAKNAEMARIAANAKTNTNTTPTFTDVVELGTREKTLGNKKKGTVNPYAFTNYFTNKAKSEKNPNYKKKYQQWANEWASYNKMTDKQLTDFLKKYGYLESNGTLSQKYYTNLGLAQGITRGNKVLSRQDTYENAQGYYNRNLVEATGPYLETALQIASGLKKPGSNGCYQVTFGNGVEYARTRAMDYSGFGNMKSSIPKGRDLSLQFRDWLSKNGVYGNVFKKKGTAIGKLPGSALEIAIPGVTVKKSTIDQFVNLARKHRYILSDGRFASGVDNATILSDLGLELLTADGKPATVADRISGDYDPTADNKWSNTKRSTSTTSHPGTLYVSIPTSVTVNSTAANLAGANTMFDQNVGGNAAAFKDLLNSIYGGMQF